MSWVTAPCQYAFFVRALAAATCLGAACGAIGVFVTMRRMSYVGHGLGHAAFGGAVLAYLTHGNFYLGASVWVIASVLVIGLVLRQRRIPTDAAIGIVTTASFALGVALLSRLGGVTRNVEAALFGHLLGVSSSDVAIALIGAVGIGALILLYYTGLVATTFDRDAAAASGIPTTRMEIVFAILLATVVVLAMRMVGVTMLAAALVIPAMTARLLTDRFSRLMATAPVLGGGLAAAGLYVSYWGNVATGAAIVLTQAAAFAGVWAWHLARSARRPVVVKVGPGPVHEHTHRHKATAHLHPHPGALDTPHHDPGHP